MNSTIITEYHFGTTKVEVEFVDDEQSTKWRLIVDGNASDFSGYYSGILVHKGFGLATAYWEGTLPSLVPFKITVPDGYVLCGWNALTRDDAKPNPFCAAPERCRPLGYCPLNPVCND